MRTNPFNNRRSETAATVLGIWLFALATAAWAEPRMTAHFIDVGQGDATLLEFPCGAMLIDAGAQDAAHVAALTDYLKAFFARRADLTNTLESVVITHNHLDHTKALRAVVENFRVKRYFDHGMLEGNGTVNPKWVRQEAAARGIAVREILDAQVPAGPDSQGLTDADIDPFACAECDPQIAVLAGRLTENPGWNQEEFDNKNNQSIVVRVAFGSTVFLFTGDAEEPELELLAARYAANKLLDADVWHVGHHGSQNATTAPLLALVTPWIAVISMGAWDYGKEGKFRFTTWYYGHPRKQTIDLLAAKLPYARQKTITAKVADKSKTFRSVRILKAIYGTAWDGTVKVSATDDSKFVVATQK